MVTHIYIMKNILITGGSGYLGGRIAYYFSSMKNINVIISTRKKKYVFPGNEKVKIFETNWDSNKSFNKLINGIDTIIHLISINSINSKINPKKSLTTTNKITSNILKFAVKNNVKKIIYFSSAHVYSSSLNGNIHESTPTRNIHPYAINHLNSEKLILDYHNKGLIQGIVLRLSNAFGPPLDLNSDCWMLFLNDI